MVYWASDAMAIRESSNWDLMLLDVQDQLVPVALQAVRRQADKVTQGETTHRLTIPTDLQ